MSKTDELLNEYGTPGRPFGVYSKTVERATAMLNMAKSLYNCPKASLYIEDGNAKKWHLVLTGSHGKLLPFWKRLGVAFRNVFYYNKIAEIFPDKMISVGFIAPKNCTGRNMLMSYDSESGEIRSEQ